MVNISTISPASDTPDISVHEMISLVRKHRKVGFRWSNKNRYSIAVLSGVVNFEIVKKPEQFDGDVLLYSFATAQAPVVYAEIRELNKKCILIAGGPHPTAKPFEALEKGFDYAVTGEGEETLPDLLRAIEEGGVEDVKGIAYMQNGKPAVTSPREYIDLDGYPPFTEKVYGPIEISRGCPFACKFCQTSGIFGTKMRHRSIEVITRYARHYGDIRFVSPNAFAYGSNGLKIEVEKIERLLKALKSENKNVYFGTFPSEVRPEFVTQKALELVKQHCANDSLHIGGQSGSQRILKEINRGHTAEDIINAVELCMDEGILPIVDFLFGLPGESREDQIASLNLAKWICSRGGKIRLHHFKPLPGTPYENQKAATLDREVEKTLGKLALEGKTKGSMLQWPAASNYVERKQHRKQNQNNACNKTQ